MTDISYNVARSTHASTIAAPLGLILIGLLAAAPLWIGRADMRLMVEIYYYLVLAQMWNLLAGYAGLVSVGQQA